MKLHVTWGHASAQQLKRVLVDSEGNNAHFPTSVDEVPAQCEVRQAFGKAPHTPGAGAPTVAMVNERLQADLLFPDDIVVLHAMDVFSKYFLLIPVRMKNPQGVRDAFCSPWVGAFDPTMSIRMDEGGEWKDDSWTESRPAGRIKLFFQGIRAHPMDSLAS